ncbi:hypothetical protein ALC57_16531, partial [Trachymyrmex cornetzi]
RNSLRARIIIVRLQLLRSFGPSSRNASMNRQIDRHRAGPSVYPDKPSFLSQSFCQL